MMNSRKRQHRPEKKPKKRTYTRPKPAPLPDTMLCSAEQIVAATGWSPPFLWSLVKDELIPKPNRYGPRMVRWLTDDIRRIIANGTGEYVPKDISSYRRKDDGAVA
jgi:predicted DNA-binding transcriptional regulator AlpA